MSESNYNKTVWSETVAITATRLNNMEEGIENASTNVTQLIEYNEENQPEDIRMLASDLKIPIRDDDLDPMEENNQGCIYLLATEEEED